MINSGSQDQSAKKWSAADLSHADCVFLLDYLKSTQPAAVDLALAALAGTLARDAYWPS